MLRESPLSTPELTLNVARGSAGGAPLVLLHGVTRNWRDFSPLLADLAARWQIFALDFRGHGKSGRGQQYLTVDYVRDAVHLLRDVADEPAVVYGHSLGAMVAAAAAAELPERVQALVLEDPPWETLGSRIHETSFHSFFEGVRGVVSRGGTIETMTRAMADIDVVTPGTATSVKLGQVRDLAALRVSADSLKMMDPAVLDPILAGHWLDGYDRDAVLRNVHCPTLLLQADWSAGGMLADADAALTEKSIANCVRVRFEGVGHLLHWEAREKVLSAVMNFLESLEGSRAKLTSQSTKENDR